MEKKTQRIRKNFKRPHLFREDLEEIELLLKNISPKSYSLETEDTKYENIDEIPKDLSDVNYFEISITKPYISIDFKSYCASIYASENSIETTGIIEKVSQII